MQIHSRFHLSFFLISVEDSPLGCKVLRQHSRNLLEKSPLSDEMEFPSLAHLFGNAIRQSHLENNQLGRFVSIFLQAVPQESGCLFPQAANHCVLL